MNPFRLRIARRHDEHVTEPHELVGTRLIDDHPAVRLRRDGEGEPGRDVRLDDARDHVDRRPLGCEHEVDTHRTGHLGDPHDGILDHTPGDHHEVVELIDDDHDVREPVEHLLVEPARIVCLAIRVDVPHARVGE